MSTAPEDKQLTVIQPSNLSIYEAHEMRELFLSTLAEHSNIEVALSQVDEIDSSGLQLLVALKNDAIKQGKSLTFSLHSQEIIELFELFNMSCFFETLAVLTN